MLVIVGYGTSSSGVIGHWFTEKEGAEIVWSTVRMAVNLRHQLQQDSLALFQREGIT